MPSYNISKIQAEVSYFDNIFVGNTKTDDHNYILIFLKFDPILMKNGFQIRLEMSYFVEKTILYHMRRSSPQLVK